MYDGPNYSEFEVPDSDGAADRRRRRFEDRRRTRDIRVHAEETNSVIPTPTVNGSTGGNSNRVTRNQVYIPELRPDSDGRIAALRAQVPARSNGLASTAD
jgi:hypothetical protein